MIQITLNQRFNRYIKYIESNKLTDMLSQSLKQLATEFQQSLSLDVNTTDEAYAHDAVHALTGLGVTLEDEELVLNITEVLQGGECLAKHTDRVINFIQLMAEADIELFTELANYYGIN